MLCWKIGIYRFYTLELDINARGKNIKTLCGNVNTQIARMNDYVSLYGFVKYIKP